MSQKMSLRTFSVLFAATVDLVVLTIIRNWRVPIGKFSREILVDNFGGIRQIAHLSDHAFAIIGVATLTLVCFFLIWSAIYFFLLMRWPFSSFPKEGCFVVVENGEEPSLVTTRGSKPDVIFTKQNLRLKDFSLGQFPQKSNLHFFPVTWVDEVIVKIPGGNFSLKIKPRFESRNIGPEYFSKYKNAFFLKQEAAAVITLAGHRMVGEIFSWKDSILSIRSEEIVSALEKDIGLKMIAQEHLFKVLGFGIEIIFADSAVMVEDKKEDEKKKKA
jgi:hypothetical protein